MSIRIFAGIVCLYCIALGLLLNGPESTVGGLAKALLDYELPAGSPLVLAARMIGLYMAFFGVTMGLVAWDPVRNRSLLGAAAVLLVLRAVQRTVYFNELHDAFGISSQKNLVYVLVVVALAVVCVVFRVIMMRDAKEASRGDAA